MKNDKMSSATILLGTLRISGMINSVDPDQTAGFALFSYAIVS